MGDRERRRVDRAGARHRRDEDGDLRHAGDDRRYADLHEDRREAPLARGHVEAGRRDRDHLFADLEAGPGLDEPPQRGGPDLGLVEEAAVADRLADAGQERRVGGRVGGGQLVGADAEVGGIEADAVEALGGVEDGRVTAGADVVEERLDRALGGPARRSRRWSGRGGGPARGRRGRPSGGRRGSAWRRERSGSPHRRAGGRPACSSRANPAIGSPPPRAFGRSERAPRPADLARGRRIDGVNRSVPARFAVIRRTVNEPLGAVVVRTPRKIVVPLSVIATAQTRPTRFWSISSSVSIRPFSLESFSFQVLAPVQAPVKTRSPLFAAVAGAAPSTRPSARA